MTTQDTPVGASNSDVSASGAPFDGAAVADTAMRPVLEISGDSEDVRALMTAPWPEFVARRSALAQQLRAAGSKQSSKQVAGLHKPSAAAWAINLLATDGRSAPALIDLGAQIASAISVGDRADLRELAVAQKLVLADVLDRCADLVSTGGGAFTSPTRDAVEAALRAVLADPAWAQQLFTGLLVALPAQDGEELLPLLAITSSAAAPTTSKAAQTNRSAGPSAAEPATSRTQLREQAAARDAARRTVREADRSEQRAFAAVAHAESERDRLRTALAQTEQDLGQARDELRRARQRAADARRARDDLPGSLHR